MEEASLTQLLVLRGIDQACWINKQGAILPDGHIKHGLYCSRCIMAISAVHGETA